MREHERVLDRLTGALAEVRAIGWAASPSSVTARPPPIGRIPVVDVVAQDRRRLGN